MKLVRIRNQAALGIYPEVVERLIMKNPSQYPWSAEVKGSVRTLCDWLQILMYDVSSLSRSSDQVEAKRDG
jgi:hypothetical protein